MRAGHITLEIIQINQTYSSNQAQLAQAKLTTLA